MLNKYWPRHSQIGTNPRGHPGEGRKTKGDKDLRDKGRRDEAGGGGILLLYFHPSRPVAKDVHESIHKSGLEPD